MYNKKAKKRVYRRKKKVIETEETKNDDDYKARKLRERAIRKSIKKVSQEWSEAENNSSSSSWLSNVTIEDIESTKKGMELNIEFSNQAKKARKTRQEYYEKRNKQPKLNEDGEIVVNTSKLGHSEYVQYLTGHTIIYILYSALNICGSKIQLTDLLRFAREGYISFYNFRKLLPPEHQNSDLSLTKYHSLGFSNYYTVVMYIPKFVKMFPDIKDSIKAPNIMMLVRRYLQDLNLPNDMADYIQNLIEFIPPGLQFNNYLIPNYEGRAMAYILFVLKLIFGIDGYREKEMSDSAKKVNHELKRTGSNETIFVYESWREFIEYRHIIYCKYYYPSLFNPEFKGKKPYETFITTIKNTNPMTFSTVPNEIQCKSSLNKFQKENADKRMNTKFVVSKLLELHESESISSLKFECSFTPLKDALDVIRKSHHCIDINEHILVDYNEHSSKYFLEPQKLLQIFNQTDIKLKVKKSTFPKNYCFKKSTGLNVKSSTYSSKEYKILHDTVDEKQWIRNFKEQQKKHESQKIEQEKLYHHRRMTDILVNRKDVMDAIKNKRKMANQSSSNIAEALSESEDSDYDEICTEFKLYTSKEKFKNKLIFRKPDFNFWQRRIQMNDTKLNGYSKDINKLPKSFLWLLNHAASVIHQSPAVLYFQLLVIENEFIQVCKPIELTDYTPILDKKECTGMRSLHRYW